MSDLLPREERIRWVLERSAALIDGGAAPVSGLVLPTGQFFPDEYDGSKTAVNRLLRRMVKLAGLSDLDIQAAVPSSEAEAGASCASGACGVDAGPSGRSRRVEKRGDGWQINALATELGNPVLLTTAFARAVSHIFMREAELYEGLAPGEAEPATDLCGVWLGFGALLCNGAYIYKKG